MAGMQIPPALLTAFPPSRQLLLDVVRRQIDEGMLREIAEADYAPRRGAQVADAFTIRSRRMANPLAGTGGRG